MKQAEIIKSVIIALLGIIVILVLAENFANIDCKSSDQTVATIIVLWVVARVLDIVIIEKKYRN